MIGVTWTFSKEAKAVANEFFLTADALLSDPDIEVGFEGWLAKAQRFYARLALTLQLMEPDTGLIVGEKAARGATDLMLNYFIPNAQAVMDLVSTGESQSRVMQRIARWLLKLDAEAGGKPAVFTVRDAMISGPRTALKGVDPELIDSRLGKMEAFGWLERIPPEGRERAPRFKVTLGIANCYEEQLKRLYETKAKIERDAAKRKGGR